MKVPQKTVFEHNQNRLVPQTRRKAIITKMYVGPSGTLFNGNGISVDLYFIDNPQMVLKQIPVSLEASQILINFFISAPSLNVRCVVDIFNETNNRQMVVAYLY